jgi:hypothetical protein
MGKNCRVREEVEKDSRQGLLREEAHIHPSRLAHGILGILGTLAGILRVLRMLHFPTRKRMLRRRSLRIPRMHHIPRVLRIAGVPGLGMGNLVGILGASGQRKFTYQEGPAF